MRLFVCLALAAFVSLSPSLATAQSATPTKNTKIVFLRVLDSKKDTEIHISKLLLERLKINTSLEMRGSDDQDLVVKAEFKPNPDLEVPGILILIDTRIAQRNKDSNPVVQIVSIASIANVKLVKDKRLEILEWMNTLNSQVVPMHAYASGDRLSVSRNLVNATYAPLSENAVASSFSRILRSWPGILKEARKRGFIEPAG